MKVIYPYRRFEGFKKVLKVHLQKSDLYFKGFEGVFLIFVLTFKIKGFEGVSSI
jgi:hypothetical protein